MMAQTFKIRETQAEEIFVMRKKAYAQRCLAIHLMPILSAYCSFDCIKYYESGSYLKKDL
jgi:hypothetical protein